MSFQEGANLVKKVPSKEFKTLSKNLLKRYSKKARKNRNLVETPNLSNSLLIRSTSIMNKIDSRIYTDYTESSETGTRFELILIEKYLFKMLNKIYNTLENLTLENSI